MGKKLCSLLIITAVVLAVLIVKAVLFFTAEPKITVNYVAELNKISKPINYDPNENAVRFYEKASSLYVEPSEMTFRIWSKSPADMNKPELNALNKWLEKNSLPLEHLKKASEKQYLWLEYPTENSNPTTTLEHSKLKNIPFLLRALQRRAKLRAFDGEFTLALEDLLTCWKVAAHYTRPKLMFSEQAFGLSIKRDVVGATLSILNLCTLNAGSLHLWQKSWGNLFSDDKYIPSFQTEKLKYYDLIQRTFVHNSRGTGRVAWKRIKDFYTLCGQWYNFRIALGCFIGPYRREVTEIVNSIFDHYEEVIKQTPWQIRIAKHNYKIYLEQMVEKDPILHPFIPAFGSYHIYYYRSKAKSEALITVIAVLRYKAEQGSYPVSLEQLVEQDYLTNLTEDPFSDGPLIYHLLDDGFELYSVGCNFKDDGAARPLGSSPLLGSLDGDEVFWPPLRRG